MAANDSYCRIAEHGWVQGGGAVRSDAGSGLDCAGLHMPRDRSRPIRYPLQNISSRTSATNCAF